ncbi:hypothetical protein [Bacillus horti]|uniref:Uncharacterized protein n=1 Tax=Caldalkalibacillus horti TaxID=77523 RepID=A0ABT9VW70_9BACI|nr:hypothetical protein [Bacillus horti]MDQ0165248.1 hypothetical protein [Bacillus horti]
MIDQSYGEWVTFFEMNHSFHISKLEKDWLGNWKLVHWDGEPGFIGGAAMDLSNNDGVILGASSITNDHENKHTSFYYGMIANSKVDQIKLEKKEWTDKNVALIETERYRFFFYVAYDRLDPFSLQALSNGEVIQQFGGGIPD